MEIMYVTYAEAQRLIPFFQREAARSSPYPGAQESAKRILSELQMVRGDVDYSPMKGKQIVLRNEHDKEFLIDTIAALG